MMMVLLSEMLATEISDLAILLIVAGVVTIIFKLLKQPVVLGYIVAGMIVGSYSFDLLPSISNGKNINLWGELGVIFLLFAMGLEFSFKKLINNGKTGFITLATMILGLGFGGFGLGILMGWGQWNSFILGCMLCLSSTTIIVKAFDDPRYKGKKFTEVVFGVLIFDDLFAILLMVFMGTLAVSKAFEGVEILFSLGKMLFFMIVWVVGGIFIVPTILKKLKPILNEETLLIVSLALCLGMVVFATSVDLSAELGAFIMGSVLAETIFLEKIEHITKPIKDFFGAIFFVSVGMLLDPSIIGEYWLEILLITLTVLIGKVIFTIVGVRFSGEKMKVAFESGLSMAQVGEFSFIVAGTAIAYGLTDDYIYPVIIAVSIITTFTTPYFMSGSNWSYEFFMSHIPPKWRDKILADDEKLDDDTPPTLWTKFIKNYIFGVLVYSALCLAIILLSINFLKPFLDVEFNYNVWIVYAQLAITLIIMAPFLKGLVYRGGEQPYLIMKLWQQNLGNRLILSAFIVLRYIIAFALIYGLFVKLLNIPIWVSAIVAVLVLIVTFKSKKLVKIYLSVEYKFVMNFNQRMVHDKRMSSKQSGSIETMDMTNEGWMEKNLYTARFEIDKNSDYEHAALKDTDFRTKYDLIIFSVIRNKKEQSFPNGDFQLQSGDLIKVVGNIMNIEKLSYQKNNIILDKISLQTIYEFSQTIGKNPQSKIECISLIVDKSSGLYQTSIKDSQMGKKGACFVVGIERNNGYLINPPANTTFLGGDIVWLLGKKETIHYLVEKNFSFEINKLNT